MLVKSSIRFFGVTLCNQGVVLKIMLAWGYYAPNCVVLK